jgi:hypothetical protein
LTLYDVAIPTYRQILGAQKGVLAKAEAHFKDKGIDPATIMAARLYDDMQPFTFQVMQVVGHSAGALSLVLGLNFTRPSGLDTFEAQQAALSGALDVVNGVDADALNAVADTEMERTMFGREMKIVPRNYILFSAFPNFYFHATTAYGLLRQAGVPIGKRDFTTPPPAA